MASRKITTYEYMDDLDGSVVEEGEIDTVSFSYRGTDYEIDLKSANANKFDTAIKKYIDSARKVGRTRGGGGTRRTGTGSGRSKEQLATIREWANKKGYEVSPRGRIPANVIEAFDAAH